MRTEDLAGADSDLAMYATVLKRGKTLSIVSACTKRFEIQGFTILSKFKDDPGSPALLSSYVAQWYQGLTGRPMRETRGRDLPLNLLLTFGGHFFTDTITNRRVTDSFDVFTSLGEDLTNPGIVRIIPINARTPDMRPICEAFPEADRQEVLRIWRENRDCREWLGENFGVLEEMVNLPDGGTNHVLKQLVADARATNRARLLERLAQTSLSELKDLFRQLGGLGVDDSHVRIRALDRWRAGIESELLRAVRLLREKKLRDDPVRMVANPLRAFLAIDPRSFEEIPARFVQTGVDLNEYIKDQIDYWQGKVLEECAIEWTGIVDKEQLQKVLQAMKIHLLTKLDAIATWMKVHLSKLSEERDRSHARNYLALRFARELRSNDKPHVELTDETIRDARILHEAHLRSLTGDITASINYASGIAPVYELIEMLKKSQRPSRDPLAGDERLSELSLIFPAFQNRPQPVN
jgi:hypothetical protein